ncbi:MAG: hypothetical protein PGN37_20130 [Mycobacterium kyogaense]|uniref:hypothetical protein n=1 Tax=Mycobacterium kyogaense TaxID=2212479 RepID=UPI002FFA4A23
MTTSALELSPPAGCPGSCAPAWPCAGDGSISEAGPVTISSLAPQPASHEEATSKHPATPAPATAVRDL